jgi:hypothetical protein
LVTVTPAPDGEWLWFVEQEPGWDKPMRLRRMRTRGNGSDAELLLPLDDSAYSIAFDPQFAETGHVFLGVNGPMAGPPRTFKSPALHRARRKA